MLIVSLVMFAAYVASDNIFAVEKTITGAAYGINQDEYSAMAGAYSIFNVYLLMLIFGGLVLDKMGIRFTGIASCVLMVLGIGGVAWAFADLHGLVASGAGIPTVNFLGSTLRKPVMWAVVGIAVFGVGAEVAGITVTKAIAKWFLGYEVALAMGLQLSLARLGTGLAYGTTPLIVKVAGGNVLPAILIGLILLVAGLLLFFVYCINDRKLDRQLAAAGTREESSSSEDEFHFKDVILVIKNPAFWLIAILCLLFYAAVNPFLKYSTGLMVDKFHISETLAGLFPMILPMGCIVLTPLFGSVYDRKGHGADLMIIGAVIITAVHLIFSIPAIQSGAIAILLMVMLGVGFAMLPSAMWPSIAKIMPAKLLGTTMALTFYIQNIGFIFVPKFVSAIKQANAIEGTNTYNYTPVMLFFAGLGVVALVIALSVKVLDRVKHYGLQEANIREK